jgi:PBSX family phage portal protein
MTVPAKSKSVPHQAGAQMFTFGEPESVLDKRELFDLFEVTHNGRWYEPPVPMVSLGKTYRMSSHHQSALLLKRNLLVSSFVPSRWLSRGNFAKWVLDWLVFGNGYLERIDNNAGRPAQLAPVPAAYTRVGIKPGVFWFLKSQFFKEAHQFAPGSVHHLVEPDPMQEIYGLPQYLSALQSGLLNESATMFRRRYYLNGSHAGFILYISEEGLGETDSNAIRKALKDSKGPGNFRNLYVHIPKGKKDGIQLMPIGEVAAKDDFLNIKEVTRDDLLAAHRVPPVLLGVVPKNTGGFGNVVDAAAVFHQLEIVPIQQRLLEVNDWLGLEAVKFDPPKPLPASTAAPPNPRA